MTICTHCGSSDITTVPHRNNDYGGVVIDYTYICNNCNYEESETKAYGRGNQLKEQLKKDTNGEF